MSDLEHAGAATDRPEAAEAPEQPNPGTENPATEVTTTTEVSTTTPTPDTGVAQNDQAESEDDGA